jgi:S-adenosylmethionine/arginine decarboxylase-like enzyme
MRRSIPFERKSHYWPLIRQFVVAVQTEEFPASEEELCLLADKMVEKLSLVVVDKFVHRFSPYGLTLVYVLSQSHLAIHSWPERKVLHIDLVTCSELGRSCVMKALEDIFGERSFFEWL